MGARQNVLVLNAAANSAILLYMNGFLLILEPILNSHDRLILDEFAIMHGQVQGRVKRVLERAHHVAIQIIPLASFIIPIGFGAILKLQKLRLAISVGL